MTTQMRGSSNPMVCPNKWGELGPEIHVRVGRCQLALPPIEVAESWRGRTEGAFGEGRAATAEVLVHTGSTGAVTEAQIKES